MTELEKANAMSPEERAAYILSIQAPSTRHALSQTAEERAAHVKSKLPANWLAVADAKDMDEAVAPRGLGYEESKVFNRMRYSRGAALAEMRKEPDADSTTPEKKNRAIAAFMYIKAKFKDLMKLAGLATEREYAEVKREK